MISLRPFLDQKSHHAAETLRNVVCILLEGISLHTFRYNRPEARTFQTNINDIRNRFAEIACDDEDEAVSLCNRTVACLDRYGADSQKFISTRTREMQTSVSLLTESLLQVSRGAVEGASTLQQVGKDLQTLSDSTDLGAINTKLRECLGAICREAERHEEVRNQIERDLTRAKMPSGPGRADPATGLPEVEDAIQAISALIDDGKQGHVLAFAVEHLETINTRFGERVANQVMQRFAQHLAQRMHANEKLFRWRGACFVAVTDENVPDSMLAADAARIASTRVELSSTVGDRDIVLPIACSWTMLKVWSRTPLAGIVSKLDEFTTHRHASHAAGHSGQDNTTRSYGRIHG